MKRYRKKPVVIEAILYDGSEQSEEACLEFIGESADVGMTQDGHFLIIKTLEGNMEADIGDYIIKGVQGEFYPCKPDIFKLTYEEVNDHE